jgi:hypothetical protein
VLGLFISGRNEHADDSADPATEVISAER